MKRSLLKSVKKVFDFFLYYFFLIDLYLLGFFSKKYPYLLFIFFYTYGTFGYTDALTDLQFLVKFVCFLFSWYLVYTSFIVFCLFNIPTSKEYLSNLLGKEFVVEKIGNPGFEVFTKFTGFAVAGLAINEVGRLADGYVIVGTANSALTERQNVIENSSHMSPKDKKQAIQESLRIHGYMIRSQPQGTFDRITRVDAHQHMMSSASKAFTSFFKK